MTPDEFKHAHPHFAKIDEELIGAYLDFAISAVNESVFGRDYEQAVFLLTAHWLSVSPKGQKARLQSDDADTVYHMQFMDLMHRKTAAGRTT